MQIWFIILALFCVFSLQALTVTPQEAAHFGKRIFYNECSSQKERLVWWSAKEPFPSLGIGHFIWYPEDNKSPFEETFPSLLSFLKKEGAPLPFWLENPLHCPWKTREEFLNASQDTKKQELQEFLFKTLSLQATFIVNRFELFLQTLLKNVSATQQIILLKHIKNLGQSTLGKFALIDYLHFKGSGFSPTERYQGKGWGLQQVLEGMPSQYDDPSAAFIETAKRVLIQRVDRAPKERHEEQWLPGWLSRLESYRS